jgi:hypothetical protein
VSQVPPQQGSPVFPQAAHAAPPSPDGWHDKLAPQADDPPPVQHSPPAAPHAVHVPPEQRAPAAVHVSLKFPTPPSPAPQQD